MDAVVGLLKVAVWRIAHEAYHAVGRGLLKVAVWRITHEACRVMQFGVWQCILCLCQSVMQWQSTEHGCGRGSQRLVKLSNESTCIIHVWWVAASRLKLEGVAGHWLVQHTAPVRAKPDGRPHLEGRGALQIPGKLLITLCAATTNERWVFSSKTVQVDKMVKCVCQRQLIATQQMAALLSAWWRVLAVTFGTVRWDDTGRVVACSVY